MTHRRSLAMGTTPPPHGALAPGGPPGGRWRRVVCCALLGVLLVGASRAAAAPPPPDFPTQIRPLLSDRCFACHGPDEPSRQADLRLDLPDTITADRGGYAAVVPGDREASELWRRISSDDPFERMPPMDSGVSLSQEEIELLGRWIDAGAPWSKHWAYVPPRRVPLPAVHDRQWPSNWIDHFILARLEQQDRRPSPDADRTTLIRRLSHDLTGLPPTTAEVRRFVADSRPAAVERLVDRLLASPAYGERMAVWWLDLVRYADTVGYHGDQDHNISPYRDYVIDALNRNIPFDRFTCEQLAGDLLPDPGPDAIIATGYNRVLQTSHEGGVQPKEYLAIYAADRVRNLSAVWLGGTLGCAQCHDHKYDPYTTRDFYSMAAFFADIDEAKHFTRGTNTLPTARPPEKRILTRLERLQLEQWEALASDLERRMAAEEVESGRKDRLEAQRRRVHQLIDATRDAARMTMITVSIEPRTMRILPRGNWLDDSGPIVQPAVPAFLGRVAVEGRRPTRLDLARWLTDADQGVGLLTARVIANRLWYLLFGQGLARNLDDFGGQGEAPTHPDLLDRLAHELVDSGWDIKHVMRLIATSRAYRQSSQSNSIARQSDPDNRLFGRQNRFRLPAEAVRDTALRVAGLLNRRIGGASVKPYQPEGYYRHLNFPQRTYRHDTDERQWRRGVYVHWQRQYLHPMLRAFDAPTREECTAQRPTSNTPLASLVLLNDPSFVEAARGLAGRMLKEGGADDQARIDFAFHLATSRTPDSVEREALEQLLDASRAYYSREKEAAQALLEIGELPLPGGVDQGELASWTSVARAILNLGEVYMRN